MISSERMEKALHFLATTDQDVADAEGEVLRSEYKHGLIKDRIFLTSDGSVAERNAKAGSSNEAYVAYEEYVQAVVRFKQIRAKRATEEQVIGVYRTQEASRRQG